MQEKLKYDLTKTLCICFGTPAVFRSDRLWR
jgi:hypothetical protein